MKTAPSPDVHGLLTPARPPRELVDTERTMLRIAKTAGGGERETLRQSTEITPGRQAVSARNRMAHARGFPPVFRRRHFPGVRPLHDRTPHGHRPRKTRARVRGVSHPPPENLARRPGRPRRRIRVYARVQPPDRRPHLPDQLGPSDDAPRGILGA